MSALIRLKSASFDLLQSFNSDKKLTKMPSTGRTGMLNLKKERKENNEIVVFALYRIANYNIAHQTNVLNEKPYTS